MAMGQKASSPYDYMRRNDVGIFHAAAQFYKVWIVVRQSKMAARNYIGTPGYVPKRLDCKAKTADENATIPGFGLKKTAGLVVNPTLPGMETAFEDGKKHARAIEYWYRFEPRCYIPEAGVQLPYFPGGKLYSIQMDKADLHYGCVTFASDSNAAGARYIHSDYDLYGIVREDDPTANVRVTETRLGETHSRGQDLFDVQHYLNRHMGVAMILHGEQEKYSNDMDDRLDVFCPDGHWIPAYGAAAIRNLYETTFQGRQLYGPDAKPRPLFGLWQAI